MTVFSKHEMLPATFSKRTEIFISACVYNVCGETDSMCIMCVTGVWRALIETPRARVYKSLSLVSARVSRVWVGSGCESEPQRALHELNPAKTRTQQR